VVLCETHNDLGATYSVLVRKQNEMALKPGRLQTLGDDDNGLVRKLKSKRKPDQGELIRRDTTELSQLFPAIATFRTL
jgi:hypothetical protein